MNGKNIWQNKEKFAIEDDDISDSGSDISFEVSTGSDTDLNADSGHIPSLNSSISPQFNFSCKSELMG